ncbi:Proteasome subunit alpha type-3 [Ilyodon furcidens]|uniref:Proteasome subunit alpha type n=2 Tax=Goodeidae TaxID=28758 RepID=A0ABV0T5B7_9TELE
MSTDSAYDLSASTFSPDGRVFQVEYAMKAVENSSTAIGIRCKDGIVFGVEKLVLSKLYEEGSNKRIFNIDRHVGMVMFPDLQNKHYTAVGFFLQCDFEFM